MGFLRNKELFFHLLLQLILLAAFTAAGFFCCPGAGFLALGLGVSLIVCQLAFTLWRYRRLTQLSRRLDELLHHPEPEDFSDYSEGELAILKNELSKLTLRLSQQNLALEEDKRRLADSMADISHQLRSPLTSLSLIHTLLQEPGLSSERYRQLLRDLSQQLARMDWLIESMLKISRMDAGTVRFSPAEITARQLVDDAAATLLVPMELKGVAFEAQYPPGTVTLTADPAWTAEALSNVIKNCMEHTPPGGQITVTIRDNTLYTEFTVEDTGSGFCREDIPHLFERFYKGKNASGNSVGIGLALSRLIVSHQNGTLKAENRTPHGARFTFRFYHPSDHPSPSAAPSGRKM